MIVKLVRLHVVVMILRSNAMGLGVCMAMVLVAACERSLLEAQTITVKPQKPLQVVDLVSMKTSSVFNELESVVVSVRNDPAYQADNKQFKGYLLLDVLKKASVSLSGEYQLRFRSRDGYQTTLKAAPDVLEGAVIAYEDLQAPPGESWLPFRSGKRWITPEPFYLVWALPYAKDKPWPYQLERIEVWPERTIDAAYPQHDPHAKAGHRLFQQLCMSCHSINLVGGSLGPELNVPKNILEYRDESTLRAFIRDPNAFRARSIMPAFGHLPASQRDAILAYIKTMRRAKVCTSVKTCQALNSDP